MNSLDAPHPPESSACRPQRPITVLVVDDHADFRAATVQFLRTLPDQLAIVGEAPDGAEALRLAAELLPDLVLMDLLMPVMGGLAATRELKARAATAPKIVIVTLFAGAACQAAVRQAGADACLAKSEVIEHFPALLRKLFPKP